MASSSVVRSAVRQLLQSSPAYKALPPDKQREIAHNTVRVASYMADPQGLLSKKKPHAPVPPPRRKGHRARGPAAAHLAVLRDPRVRDAVSATSALLQQVDFPDFVGDLIQGVFQSIVQASIQQMEAYGEMLEQVSESVDQFVKDHISDDQARDHLTDTFPEQLARDPRGRMHWRVDPERGARLLAAALWMPCPAHDLRDIVAAARRRLAIQRQQLLSTMVLMGINRVVVTNGRITAKGG